MVCFVAVKCWLLAFDFYLVGSCLNVGFLVVIWFLLVLALVELLFCLLLFCSFSLCCLRLGYFTVFWRGSYYFVILILLCLLVFGVILYFCGELVVGCYEFCLLITFGCLFWVFMLLCLGLVRATTLFALWCGDFALRVCFGFDSLVCYGLLG